MNSFPYGFRVVGSASSHRRLVDWQAAFAAYAACDECTEPHLEAYLSAFTYAEEFSGIASGSGRKLNVRGFDGPCFAPWLWVDVDDTCLANAAASARRFVASTLQRFTSFAEDSMLYFFSGTKGFHIGMPTPAFSAEPSRCFNRIARSVCAALAVDASVRIDATVYDKVRLFRAPNSRHPKSGLYKRHLTHDELMGLSVDRVLQLAVIPCPFDLPDQSSACPGASSAWKSATLAISSMQTIRTNTPEGAACKLQRNTLDFLHGYFIPTGEREICVFRAAANLAEALASEELIITLLESPARNCGLTRAETLHAIRSGIESTARKRVRNG